MKKKKLDKAGCELLAIMKKGFNLGGKGFSREEIYETDRY
jgi:hypothetical protein